MKFEELDKRHVHEVEENILKKWKEEDILNETIKLRDNSNSWVFTMDLFMQMLSQEFIMFLLKQ